MAASEGSLRVPVPGDVLWHQTIVTVTGSRFSPEGLPLCSTFDGNAFKSTAQQSSVAFTAERAAHLEERVIFDCSLQ